MAQIKEAKESFDQILAAEKAADDRRNSRNSGYGMARNQRDPGHVHLTNNVRMFWHGKRDEFEIDGTNYVDLTHQVPEGMFMLEIAGKRVMFDAEEFRKYLRWA